MLTLGALAVLCLYACSTLEGIINTNRLLFTNVSEKGRMDFSKNPEAQKVQNIKFDRGLLQSRDTLPTAFFSERLNILITARKDSREVSLWEGKILGEENSYVLFSERKNVIVGNINRNGILYQVRAIGNSLHQLIQVDQTKFPQEGEPIIPDLSNEVPIQKDCPNTDPPDFIDVMVIYTQTAESAAGGAANIEAEIYLAVHETNFSYQQSGVNQRINLVHVSKTSYPETGNMSGDLMTLRTDANTVSTRNSFSADAVVAIVETGSYCGIAYFMSTVNPGFDDYAFSVVRRSCATGYYSFGHELGHNMGCDHDCANSSGSTPYVHSHGFSHCGTGKYRTVMAYNNCGEPRVPRWSNPTINYNGIPMGTSTGTCQACNACTLNNTALTVANFRCSSAGVPNVWMKDTWNDTGAEPNPNLASEPMWISPYIWVRNQKDNFLLHQHQHENPELGQSNWIYVKLQNGGTAATGDLKIYYANASVSLNWPSDWTLLATKPTSIPASSTEIVEHEWTTLPGTGHYCLLARWESASDPMATAETIDINYNTIQNNNIVWRNLNIVDLVPDQLVKVKTRFKSIPNSSIVFQQAPALLNGRTFLEDKGNIRIRFDEKTSRLLQANDVQFRNLKALENNTWGLINNEEASIVLPDLGKDYQGEIEISFERTRKKTLANYRFHVMQKDREARTIGGVSYEIKTRDDKTATAVGNR